MPVRLPLLLNSVRLLLISGEVGLRLDCPPRLAPFQAALKLVPPMCVDSATGGVLSVRLKPVALPPKELILDGVLWLFLVLLEGDDSKPDFSAALAASGCFMPDLLPSIDRSNIVAMRTCSPAAHNSAHARPNLQNCPSNATTHAVQTPIVAKGFLLQFLVLLLPLYALC